MNSLPVVLLLTVVTTASAQQIVSPEVHPDGRVTFRLRAPNAKEVVLRCEGTKGGPMQKAEGGVWSITTEPLQPDVYAYSFAVDGLKMIDPANPLLKYNLLNTDSQVHVPGPATLSWETNDVPHGVVHRHFYRSAIVGADRPFLVYTPPGYDPAGQQSYPVLYLLHGYSDAEDAWTSVGGANIILDNLIAQGRAKPMLVVMPLGYGNKEVIAGGWAGLRNTGVWQDSIVKFRDALLGEVIPQVEKAYRVSADRNARAITGLSMGGTQSLFIGLNALDRFAWIGAFSSGGLEPNFDKAYPAVNETLNARLRLLWIACGRQDGLIGLNQKLVEWLKSKGVRLTWVETPGTHSFTVWRRYLADLAPLLFQDAPGSKVNPCKEWDMASGIGGDNLKFSGNYLAGADKMTIDFAIDAGPTLSVVSKDGRILLTFDREMPAGGRSARIVFVTPKVGGAHARVPKFAPVPGDKKEKISSFHATSFDEYPGEFYFEFALQDPAGWGRFQLVECNFFHEKAKHVIDGRVKLFGVTIQNDPQTPLEFEIADKDYVHLRGRGSIETADGKTIRLEAP